MKEFVRWTALSFALFASGCVSLLPETAPPAPRYHISPVADASLQGAPFGWSLTVDDPRAAGIYNTTRIAVSSAPGKIEFLRGAEWTDRAPRLFRIALIQSFEDAGRILAVGDRTSIPLGDIVLETDIRRMEMVLQNGSRQGRLSVFARLSDGKGEIYAARRFDAAAPARGANADASVAALNDAFAGVIAQIIAWTYEEGGAARSS